MLFTSQMTDKKDFFLGGGLGGGMGYVKMFKFTWQSEIEGPYWYKAQRT